MDFLGQGMATAAKLLFSLDREVYSIVFLSLRISSAAILAAALVGVPLGYLVGAGKFRGRNLLGTLLNTFMALPTVIVGLFVFTMLSQQGPLGSLNLLFTVKAVIIGQFILATPIVAALTMSAVQEVDIRVRPVAKTLGAGSVRIAWTVLEEARFALIAAVIAGFGRAIAEVGSALVLGGNIKGYTRTVTTAIAMETSKGEYGMAIALGIILLIVSFAVNIFFRKLQARTA
jgi:tungstate transport system permease protein